MANEFFNILTAVGKAKLAGAVATGVPMALTTMALGDGENGDYYNPVESQTALKHEVWRGNLNSVYVDSNNQYWVVAELLLPDDVGGWYVREVGILDSDGDLVAIGKYPESYKPVLASGSTKQFYVKFFMEVGNTAAVTLQVDPNVVTATRQYVDAKVASELARLDSKQSVRAATTGAIALTGLQTVDGVVLAAGDRVLVKDQAAGKDNGIYIAAAGAWSRAPDADAALEVTPGMLIPVEQGAVNGDSIWQLVTDGQIAIGQTALSFEMAAGRTGVAAGSYSRVTVDARGRVTGGTNPTPSESVAAPALVSTQAQTDAGTDDNTIVTPKKLSTRLGALLVQATEAAFGWAKIATQAQTDTGTDDTSIVTPKKLATRLGALLKQATETAFGWARIATQAQTDMGTDDTTIVTPKKLVNGFASIFSSWGNIKFPTWLGGFLFQWGVATVGTGQTGVPFPTTFPNACYGTFIMNSSGSAGLTLAVSSVGVTGFNAIASTGGNNHFWFAFGR